MSTNLAEILPAAFRERPIDCALILGSGWGDALAPETIHAVVPYTDLPDFGAASVVGHKGELLLMILAGRRVVVFSGRRHYYEGCPIEQVVYPIRVLKALGIKTLLITNAAGGINANFHAGDLMVLTDHINLTGVNPLRGPHDPEWCTRFPDMSHVYDPELSQILLEQGGETMRQGVYVFSPGPSYETPAEIRAYRTLGADAVGMSTVPEAIMAHAGGIRVAALSCITNMAAGLHSTTLVHEEVLAESESAKPRMAALLKAFVANCPKG
jgi:purine-nucleoside phosphorylase